MPDVPKTAAAYDRQVAARAVCFTAVLATGRKHQRLEFPCTGDVGRYHAFLNANTKAAELHDAYGRRGMVYAVDAAGRDVHLAESIWPELATVLRRAAGSPTHYDDQPQQKETHMPKAKKHATKPTKKTTKPAKATTAQRTGHRPLKTTGVIYTIKKYILENPGITAADLTAKLMADGFTPSQATIASFRTDFVHSLRVLKASGIDIPGVQA